MRSRAVTYESTTARLPEVVAGGDPATAATIAAPGVYETLLGFHDSLGVLKVSGSAGA
ncbi:MAG: hypothetical protein M5U19_16385 [Microthrixaceae bacterium]|nr:hypothetical protein [Microthrixaceae bacterium]